MKTTTMQILSGWRSCLAGALGFLLIGTAQAQDLGDQVLRAGPSASLTVPLYKSRIVELPKPVSRISVGNPDIADILTLRSTQLYVLGKDLGTTNVLLWDKDDFLVSAIAVNVTHDLENLKRQIDAVLPGEPIEVHSARRDIILAGQVTSAAKMDAAVHIAESFLEQAATAKEKIMFQQKGGGGGPEGSAGKVINLMTVGGAQQVMLEVKVAELQRNELMRLNSQLSMLGRTGQTWTIGGVNGGASFPDAHFLPGDVRIPILGDGTAAGGNPVGPVFKEFLPNTQTITSSGLFTGFIGKNFTANLVLDMAREHGLAKVLAEPTLTTLSGQEAQFLSGGSFPIPVPQQNGTTSIDFKDFGVSLRFVPVILDSNRISLKLHISVSDIGEETVIQTSPTTVFRVPERLSERRAVSTVELADGESIGIAGLLNENMRSLVTKFPLLGDIPILGQLFRSQQWQKGETELVILVTPRLAKPIGSIETVKLPTDSFVDPSQTEFYLLGRIEGDGQPKARPAAVKGGGPEGSFGHSE